MVDLYNKRFSFLLPVFLVVIRAYACIPRAVGLPTRAGRSIHRRLLVAQHLKGVHRDSYGHG